MHSALGESCTSKDPLRVGFIRLHLIHKSQVAGACTMCGAYINRAHVPGYARPNVRNAREIGCFRRRDGLCQLVRDRLRSVGYRIVRAGGLSDCGCAAHARRNGLVALRNRRALWSAREVQEIERSSRKRIWNLRMHESAGPDTLRIRPNRRHRRIAPSLEMRSTGK